MPIGQSEIIELNTEINRLAAMTAEALRIRWAEVFKRPAPLNAQREFLLGSLAYELQVRRFKPLPPAMHRQLCAMARDLSRRSGVQKELSLLRPGTRLLRTWQEETHEVLALEKGFSYRGETYASLSEVARVITGARWSGPVFFGLKKPSPKKPKPSLGEEA